MVMNVDRNCDGILINVGRSLIAIVIKCDQPFGLLSTLIQFASIIIGVSSNAIQVASILIATFTCDQR